MSQARHVHLPAVQAERRALLSDRAVKIHHQVHSFRHPVAFNRQDAVAASDQHYLDQIFEPQMGHQVSAVGQQRDLVSSLGSPFTKPGQSWSQYLVTGIA